MTNTTQNQKPTILMVEDDAIAAMVQKSKLEELGVEVELAKTGEEALTMAEKGYPLILMDLGLPGISGIEATRQLRERENTQNTPIVAVTANVDQHHRDQAQEVGMNDFLSKPVSPTDFERILKEYGVL